MRAGLAASQLVRPGDMSYPKGSIVLCQACLLPLYRLERGIGVGERGGRAVSAFKPVTEAVLLDLIARACTDHAVSAGMAAVWRSWSDEKRQAMLSLIPEPRSGDALACPFCGACWAHARAVEADEVHDHAYTLELVTIPPAVPIPATAVRAWRM